MKATLDTTVGCGRQRSANCGIFNFFPSFSFLPVRQQGHITPIYEKDDTEDPQS